MYNNTGFRKETYGNRNQILFAVEHQVSMSILVDKSVGVPDGYGRLIAKAGTPLAGDLDDRITPFTKATDENVTGILLHDVDVTIAENNGSLLIFGFVNVNRLEENVQELITDDVKAALPLVTFAKC